MENKKEKNEEKTTHTNAVSLPCEFFLLETIDKQYPSVSKVSL